MGTNNFKYVTSLRYSSCKHVTHQTLFILPLKVNKKVIHLSGHQETIKKRKLRCININLSCTIKAAVTEKSTLWGQM